VEGRARAAHISATLGADRVSSSRATGGWPGSKGPTRAVVRISLGFRPLALFASRPSIKAPFFPPPSLYFPFLIPVRLPSRPRLAGPDIHDSRPQGAPSPTLAVGPRNKSASADAASERPKIYVVGRSFDRRAAK
jgi:hypothetical protein